MPKKLDYPRPGIDKMSSFTHYQWVSSKNLILQKDTSMNQSLTKIFFMKSMVFRASQWSTAAFWAVI